MQITALLTLQQNASKELMRYGYARTTETTEINQTAPPPMMVVMTPKGYKMGDELPVSVNGVRVVNKESDSFDESLEDQNLVSYPDDEDTMNFRDKADEEFDEIEADMIQKRKLKTEYEDT
jgi:hypothetical protein